MGKNEEGRRRAIQVPLNPGELREGVNLISMTTLKGSWLLLLVHLELLQADDVGLPLRQPHPQVLEPGPQPVDVPCRDTHGPV